LGVGGGGEKLDEVTKGDSRPGKGDIHSQEAGAYIGGVFLRRNSGQAN